MQIRRKITAVILSILMLVSNTGFILQYSCCIENAKVLLNVFENENCCEENLKKTVNCCSGTEKITVSRQECAHDCFIVNEYKKLDEDQISSIQNKFQQYFIPLCTIEFIESNIEIQNSLSLKQSSYAAPCEWGRTLLISFHKIKIPVVQPA